MTGVAGPFHSGRHGGSGISVSCFDVVVLGLERCILWRRRQSLTPSEYLHAPLPTFLGLLSTTGDVTAYKLYCCSYQTRQIDFELTDPKAGVQSQNGRAKEGNRAVEEVAWREIAGKANVRIRGNRLTA